MAILPHSFEQSQFQQKKQRSPALKILFSIVVLYACAGLVWFGVFVYTRVSNPPVMATYIPSEYQAVFLDNNQVYFGKITAITSTLLTIQDIYYLNTSATGSSTSEKQLSLIKLGTEIHAPEDEMFIPLAHVLYYENLQPTSRVVTAIEAQGK